MIFAIALTTFLLLLNLGIREHFEESYETYARSAVGTTDIVMSVGEESTKPLLEKEDVNWSSVSTAERLPILFSTGSIDDETDGMIKVQTFGVDVQEAATFNVVEVLDKRPDAFVGNAIIVSEKTASRFGYSLGDSMDLNVNGQYKTFTIHAIVQSKGFFQQETEQAISALIPFEQANKLFGTVDQFNLLYIHLLEDKDVSTAIESLKADNPTLSIQPAMDEKALETQTGAIFLALAFVLIIVLMISFYIISSLFKVIMTERIPMIGTFQSIGASKRQVRLLLLGEGALYGLLGACFGIVSALLFSPRLYRLLNAFPSEEGSGLVMVKVSHLLIALLFALVVSLVSTFVAIRQLNRYSTKQIILRELEATMKKSAITPILGVLFIVAAIVLTMLNTSYQLGLGLGAILCLLVGVLLLSNTVVSFFNQLFHRLVANVMPYEVVLGMKNVSHNKFANSNIKLITIVLTLIITVYTVIYGVQNFMTDISTANDFDISITQLDRNADTYQFLDTVDGVEEVYNEYLGFGHMQKESLEMDSMTFIGLDEQRKFKTFHQDGVQFEEQDADQLFTGKHILIDQFVAKKYRLSVGDEVMLFLEGEEEQGAAYTVVGFMDSANFVTTRKSAMLSLENFQEDLTNVPFQILLKTDGKRKEIQKQIAEQLVNTPSTVKTLDETIDQSMQGVDSLFTILNVFILLSVLLAGFGIINNLLISFLQRQREVAVLHSICMSKGQLHWMFFMEAVGAFLFSSGLALAVSYAICYLLPNFLWGAGIAFVFTYPLTFAFTLIGGLGIVFLLATLVPIFKLSRMRIVHHLKFD